jgi:mannose PTS system EIIA component
MSTGILIIAHAPLASALRSTVLHALADCAPLLAALDVDANAPPTDSLSQAETALHSLHADEVLLVTDVVGATPFNVAKQLQVKSSAAHPALRCKLITGANVPMLLRAGTYCSGQGLDALMERVKQGGINGIVEFSATTAP